MLAREPDKLAYSCGPLGMAVRLTTRPRLRISARLCCFYRCISPTPCPHAHSPRPICLLHRSVLWVPPRQSADGASDVQPCSTESAVGFGAVARLLRPHRWRRGGRTRWSLLLVVVVRDGPSECLLHVLSDDPEA